MKPLRLGIIGCGEIAGYVALFARLTPGLRLAACCDRTIEVAGRFAKRHGIPLTLDDYRALIAREEVDALYAAVPHHLHFDVLREAIAAGKPVLCEKPVTRTLAEGLAVAVLAEEAGVKVGVNYQYRYDTAAYALAGAARSGQLGRLLYARCNVPWRRTAAYFDRGPWRARPETAGGGTLLTQGSHMLDLALWAMGSPPRAAVGMTARRKFTGVAVEDLAQGILELEDGAQVEITSAMIADREQALRVEVYGERGTAVYTDLPWPRVRFTRRGVRPPRLPVRGLHALHRSLIAFRDWVREDRPYLIPARAALPALAAVEAIYRSAETGRRVELASLAAADKPPAAVEQSAAIELPAGSCDEKGL